MSFCVILILSFVANKTIKVCWYILSIKSLIGNIGVKVFAKVSQVTQKYVLILMSILVKRAETDWLPKLTFMAFCECQ